MNFAIGIVKYASTIPAIAIKIEAIIKSIIACFSLSKLALNEFTKILQAEPLLSPHMDFNNLYMKLNKTIPLAHAKIHDENSKIP